MISSILMLILGLPAQLPAADASGDSLSRAVHDAFVSNQAAFPFGRVEFTYIQGTARDAETARDGDFEPCYVASGQYVFDGKIARYERIFPEEEMRKSSKFIDNNIISILDSFRITTDSERTLYDSLTATRKSLIHSTKLVPTRREFDRGFRFPISLGQPGHSGGENLGKLLQDAFRSEPDTRIAKVENDLSDDHRTVTRVVFELKYGEREYWIDLERGAVPLKIISRIAAYGNSPASQSIVHFDDLRFIPGRGWLPFKESWWHSRDNRGGQIIIDEATFDKPPDKSAFGIDFAKPTTLVDEGEWVRYPAQRVWNIAQLPSPHAPGVEKVEFATIPLDALPKLPGERTAGPRYLLLILGCTALAAAVALILWTRRTSHA